MNTFAAKEKRLPPVPQSRLQASRFGHRNPAIKAQQAETLNILRSIGAQAELTIGQPNDIYEQEANRVADRVMRMSNSDIARRTESEVAQPMHLQAKEMAGETPEVSSGIIMKSGGQPLDAATRSFFEPRFGHDFGHVRVHRDEQAGDISRSINARAFTLGNNIVFGSRQYRPYSNEGKYLLGHELTHVIQQQGKPGKVQRKVELRKPDQPGLSSHLSQFSNHPTIGGTVKSKYLSSPGLLKASKEVIKKLFENYNLGKAALNFNQFISLAKTYTQDMNTALLVCHNVARAFARGSDPDISISRSGSTYTALGTITVTLKSGHASIFPYIFDVKSEFGFAAFSDTQKIRDVAGDWYHYFVTATAAMTGNRADMSFKNPPMPTGGPSSFPEMYTWATGEGINVTMDWLTSKGAPSDKGWRYSNSLSMIEGGYYSKSQKELRSESISHMRGAIRGVKESGHKVMPKWKWFVPKSACLKTVLSELIQKLGGSYTGTSFQALKSYYSNPLNISELLTIKANAKTFNFKAFYASNFKPKLKEHEIIQAQDESKLALTWKPAAPPPVPAPTPSNSGGCSGGGR